MKRNFVQYFILFNEIFNKFLLKYIWHFAESVLKYVFVVLLDCGFYSPLILSYNYLLPNWLLEFSIICLYQIIGKEPIVKILRIDIILSHYR